MPNLVVRKFKEMITIVIIINAVIIIIIIYYYHYYFVIIMIIIIIIIIIIVISIIIIIIIIISVININSHSQLIFVLLEKISLSYAVTTIADANTRKLVSPESSTFSTTIVNKRITGIRIESIRAHLQ